MLIGQNRLVAVRAGGNVLSAPPGILHGDSRLVGQNTGLRFGDFRLGRIDSFPFVFVALDNRHEGPPSANFHATVLALDRVAVFVKEQIAMRAFFWLLTGVRTCPAMRIRSTLDLEVCEIVDARHVIGQILAVACWCGSSAVAHSLL